MSRVGEDCGDDGAAVVQFVRSGKATMPAAVEARLRASLRATKEAAAGTAREPRALSSAGNRWMAAAIVLAGIGVTAAILWEQRRPVLVPAGPQEPAPQEPQPAPAPQFPKEAPADMAAADANLLDAPDTLAKVAVLLVVEPEGVPADHRCRAKVLRVLKGDPALVGKSVSLAWSGPSAPGRDADLAWGNAAPGQSGFLDVTDLGQAGQGAAGTAWLLTLEWHGQHGELLEFRSPFQRTLGATRVRKETPGKQSADVMAALRAELLSALQDAEPSLRVGAMTALCNWDGPRGSEPVKDSPWRDPAVAELLLSHGDDVDATVREQLAASVPTLTGDAGRSAVNRLLFDRIAAVRSAALNSLKGFGLPGWWGDLGRIRDTFWIMFTRPESFRSWQVGAEAKAKAEGITTAVGVWERQLKKQVANQLSGALGLGTTGDPAALPLLQDLAEHRDARVRAAAAGSRVLVHDRTGYDALRTMTCGTDELGAVCALDMLRGLATRESLDVVEQATRDPRRLVRALAAAGLRDLRSVAPHLVDARLGDLQKDPEEMVRIAAGGR